MEKGTFNLFKLNNIVLMKKMYNIHKKSKILFKYLLIYCIFVNN